MYNELLQGITVIDLKKAGKLLLILKPQARLDGYRDLRYNKGTEKPERKCPYGIVYLYPPGDLLPED